MYANLMSASRSQAAAHNSIFAEALQHLVFGNSITSAFFDNSHLFTVVFITGDKRFNHAAVCLYVAAYYSKIGTLSCFSLYLLRQGKMRRIILGTNHNTAGILIQTVHDTRADNAVDTR